MRQNYLVIDVRPYADRDADKIDGWNGTEWNERLWTTAAIDGGVYRCNLVRDSS
ncbi:hypothetical protein P171DRAFT_431815 [Karstenula rhodostoma CBS 690.94]|uniref:Uncharacterized protein n=1 Tax=Karstenula rhodostoma CBS 690.94 TaxID=1392251 RepID=A0A9P4PLE1_9PLEO|nr:hypothetical protein P171DRAFT_431815 [Karstenula rhodostoma CBS 690.94]